MRYTKLLMLALFAVLASGTSSASVILLDSRAGLSTDLGIDTVAITAHPLWQPNNPVNPGDPSDSSAVWISYKDSGYGGSQLQTYQGTTPVVTVFDTFSIVDDGLLRLNVWADDTADVLIDGSYLFHAVFTQSTCSGQPIGCRPQDAGTLIVPLSAGDHTLSFVLYQVGTETNTIANPFGLLYTGTVVAPEPGTYMLAGIALIGIATVKRRKRS